MEAFFKTHKYLVEHLYSPVRRGLMDEIDWNDRLIGIKGSRGVGKTTFLLDYAREHLNELFGKKYPKNFRKNVRWSILLLSSGQKGEKCC